MNLENVLKTLERLALPRWEFQEMSFENKEDVEHDLMAKF
jgi:hypothetical protein